LQVKEGIDAVIVDCVLAIRKGLQQSEGKAKAATPDTLKSALATVVSGV